MPRSHGGRLRPGPPAHRNQAGDLARGSGEPSPPARRRFPEVLELRHAGVTPAEIAARLGISRSSVFRALREAKVVA
ncbi:helix-turn-helix domain-containing protein [Azospirillum sp.]|uniref:helix-turn-helix domain-containing protein n=1 Tax=Azospirillum sp. TaxID=34012 RepID=UPI0039C87EDA